MKETCFISDTQSKVSCLCRPKTVTRLIRRSTQLRRRPQRSCATILVAKLRVSVRSLSLSIVSYRLVTNCLSSITKVRFAWARYLVKINGKVLKLHHRHRLHEAVRALRFVSLRLFVLFVRTSHYCYAYCNKVAASLLHVGSVMCLHCD